MQLKNVRVGKIIINCIDVDLSDQIHKTSSGLP